MLPIASLHGALTANSVGVSGIAYHPVSLQQSGKHIRTLKVCSTSRKAIMLDLLSIYCFLCTQVYPTMAFQKLVKPIQHSGQRPDKCNTFCNNTIVYNDDYLQTELY